MRRVGLAMAAVAVALLLVASGCGGGPKRLGSDETRTLADARERIGDALEQEETMRTDPRAARSLRDRVRKVVESGSFESNRPDEFGIAMLGELRRYAPSLVQVRRTGDVYALDKPATTAFLQYATTDPVRALSIPVRRQVDRIAKTLDDADAKPGTDLPPNDPNKPSDETVGSYLKGQEGDLRPRYPRESARLTAVRKGL